MNIKGLSNVAKMELKYYIWSGLSHDMDKLIEGKEIDITKETIKQMLDWYKDNVIVDYNSLNKKFNRIE